MAPTQTFLLHFYIDLIAVDPGLFCWEKSAMKMIFFWKSGLSPWPLTQTGHFLIQNCFSFLIKCGLSDEDDDFPAPFLFHSSSLDELSMSFTAVVEIHSTSIDFSIFMRFLSPHHDDQGWNQQKMMEFWLLQLSPCSGCHGRKNEKENPSKNRCHILRTFQKENGHKKKKSKKSVQKSPATARKHCLRQMGSIHLNGDWLTGIWGGGHLHFFLVAGPRRRRSVQIEWLSAGTAHLGFPALLSVPHLLSREIKMNRRHCTQWTNLINY